MEQNNLDEVREVAFAKLGLNFHSSTVQFTNKFVWMPISISKGKPSRTLSFKVLSGHAFTGCATGSVEALRQNYEGFKDPQVAQDMIDGVVTQKEQMRQRGGEIIPVILAPLELRVSLVTFIICLPQS